MTTQRTLLKDTVKRLKEANIDMPVLDARLLLQFALGIDWAAIFTGPDRELAADEQAALEALVQRRLSREPIARIVGRRAFWKFDLAIGPATLDPRPDTETLIMAVLKKLPDVPDLSILDLGTGSGAILLALLNDAPHARGVGIDISEDAIAIASANALEYGMNTRSEFLVRDWNDGASITNLGQFDIVVSNPPYIPAAEISTLAPEVKDYDPHAALNGGEDGLDAYRAIAKLLPQVMKPGGLLAVEIGMGQGDAVEEILTIARLTELERVKDLSGIDRVIIGKNA